MTDDEHHFGFMGPLLGRAKKVLFPDVDASRDGGFGLVPADAATSSRPKPGKKAKSRARRARLAASNSSLAEIASRPAESVAGSDSSSLRYGGVDKENKAPKSFPFANRRGNSQRMDSLAANFGAESNAHFKTKQVTAARQMVNGVAVRRRKSKSSLQCSLSLCSGEQPVNSGKAERIKQPSKAKFEAGSREKQEIASQNVVSNKQDADKLSWPSESSLTNSNSASWNTENSTTHSLVNHKKNRRRGRRNHPVSSLVQDQVSRAKSKTNSGLSSLMSLPSSTQKTQKTTSSSSDNRVQEKLVSKHTMTDEALFRVAVNSCANSGEAGNQSGDVDANIASLTNHVKSLNIGDDSGDISDKMNCSTPLTIRHRASPNGIASPPGFLHSFSTLSSSNLFSPLIDSNPKKRFDSKKTPEAMVAIAAERLMEPSSSPTNPYACQRNKSNPNLEGNERESCSEDNESSSGDAGQLCASPRILITSSTFISSPDNRGEALSVARSNLFPSPSDANEKEVGTPGQMESSDVIEIEPPTPPFSECRVEMKETKVPDSQKVSEDRSAKMEVETKTATQIISKNDESSNSALLHADRKEINWESSAELDEVSDAKANAEAFEPRKSTRQSQQTDRLTLADWRKKKKKRNKKDKKVWFNKSANHEKPAVDLIEEKVGPPPFQEEIGISKEDPESCSISTHTGTQENQHADKNKEDCESSDDENITLHDLIKEVKPSYVLHRQDENALDEPDAPRRSSRQSQQTDRLTVADWRKRKKKKDGTVQFIKLSSINTKASADDLIKERSTPNPPLEQASKQNENTDNSISNSYEAPENSAITVRAECQSKWQSMIATPKVHKSGDKKDDSMSNDEDEDDLFDSSPYRLQRQDDNALDEPDAPRRSSRQSQQTDRLSVADWRKRTKKKDGTDQFNKLSSINTKAPADDLIKERSAPTPPLGQANTNEVSENSATTVRAENKEWSNDELKLLRTAQQEINPTSAFYWNEVAMHIATKSSSECQNKWHSMIATPKVHKSGNKKDDSMSNDEEEDDLFDSSPYREADREDEGDAVTARFSSFGYSSGLSPCTKMNMTLNIQQTESSALKFRRKGYNSYIQNLRRDIGRAEKKKNPQRPIQHLKSCTHIYADSVIGESQMTAKLLQDGTVTINEPLESEIEDDIWGGEAEDEEED